MLPSKPATKVASAHGVLFQTRSVWQWLPRPERGLRSVPGHSVTARGSQARCASDGAAGPTVSAVLPASPEQPGSQTGGRWTPDEEPNSTSSPAAMAHGRAGATPAPSVATAAQGRPSWWSPARWSPAPWLVRGRCGQGAWWLGFLRREARRAPWHQGAQKRGR